MFWASKLSDKELVKGCLGNNRRMQELLYKKYFDSIFAMCLSYTADKDVALEIVNIGMLKVFMKIDKYSFQGSLEGWIKKIVFRCLSEYYKKENKYRNHIILEDRDKIIGQKALNDLYFQDLLELIDKLPQSSSKVFRLFVLEGYSHKEIAKKLSITEGTSKWHLNNARTKLKELVALSQLNSNVG